MSSESLTARAEWKAHWPMVLTGMLGYCFATTMAFSLGLFIEPMTKELGWSRSELSIGFTISSFTTFALSPFMGAAIDRWGARRLAIPSLMLAIPAVAAFGHVYSVPMWIAVWIIHALVSLALQLTLWTTAISSNFTAGRGLALAFTISGTALAGIIVPPIAFALIESFGWRDAFAWLGVGLGLPPLIMVFFFLYDQRDRARTSTTKEVAVDTAELPGLTIAEAIRSVALWRIGISTLLIITLAGSLIVHQVPILTEAGVTRETASLLASLTGVAGFFGKVVTGWLMDRMHAAKISGLTFAGSAIGFGLLLEPLRTPETIVLAMIITGYSGGAKLQVSAYLTARYGGLRNYGKIFGVMGSTIAMGAGLGPLLAAGAFDLTGSYAPFLIGGIPGFLIAGLLIYGLGPYPQFETGKPRQDASDGAGITAGPSAA